MKNLGIKKLKNILNFYNIKIPKNIFHLKKTANKIIINQLCDSNCENSKCYKKIISILHRKKKVISNQKKKKCKQTKKHYTMIFKKTRTRSPIHYLEA